MSANECYFYLLPFTFYLYLSPFTFYLLPFAFYLLPFTFCLLPFTFYLSPFTFYLLPFLYNIALKIGPRAFCNASGNCSGMTFFMTLKNGVCSSRHTLRPFDHLRPALFPSAQYPPTPSCWATGFGPRARRRRG